MKKWIIPLAGIAGIVALDMFALSRGFDGQLTALASAAIGAIATGGSIKIWGQLKAKGFHINFGREKE